MTKTPPSQITPCDDLINPNLSSQSPNRLLLSFFPNPSRTLPSSNGGTSPRFSSPRSTSCPEIQIPLSSLPPPVPFLAIINLESKPVVSSGLSGEPESWAPELIPSFFDLTRCLGNRSFLCINYRKVDLIWKICVVHEEGKTKSQAVKSIELLFAHQMEDFNFVVGQQFADVKTFRKAIKEAAIAQHFELKIIKSDLIRYFAKCAKEDCPWRIRAVKLPNVPTFTIRSIEGTHTCGKTAQLGHHQASVDWIVNLIEERLRDNVNYKPKDILQDIQKQYGITIPYKQAWRAKERGLAAIYGSSEEGYCLLPAYCEQIKLSNPGSIAQVFTTGSDHRFQRLFVSFNASINGFLHGCLPIIGLGGMELKSKYLGTLLSVTSFDADGGLFPVAFGIVDLEIEESWMWFLSEFHKLLEISTETIPQLTVLSDGQKGIVEAVRRKFPTAYQGICMHHLTESINKEFKNGRLVQLLWKAAYSITTIGFRERMAEIEEVCAEAAKRIQQVPPNRWAVVYFEGSRFGHLSSNIEEFNKWILEACELPIIQVIERIHGKLMAEFKERHEKGMTWTSVLAPSVEKRISDAIESALSYQVLRSDEVEFEVLSSDRSNIVNIGTRCCSCRDWQLYGAPCSHAAAALLSCRKNIYEYTEKYFTVSKYRETYSQPIYPIPDKIEWSKATEGLTDDENRVVRPPKFRRPPGRPEKKRLCMKEGSREKHTVHCSRCNQTGHYKRTCKAGVAEMVDH